MGNRFRRFMEGRYGSDNLSRFMLIIAVVLLITNWILGKFVQIAIVSSILSTVTLVLLILNLVRMMSRNYQARYAENQRFLRVKASITGFFKGQRTGARDKNHKIFKCPACGQKLRVPKGRGRIAITCSKCKTQFVKKT